jgi:hypothetical protein
VEKEGNGCWDNETQRKQQSGGLKMNYTAITFNIKGIFQLRETVRLDLKDNKKIDHICY